MNKEVSPVNLRSHTYDKAISTKYKADKHVGTISATDFPVV
jgi:hypothetical protein